MAVDSKGKVQSLVLKNRALSRTVADCLRRELSFWEFGPALIEGQPVASRIRLIVLFDASEEGWERWENEYAREVVEGVTLLTLVPSPEGQGQWSASFSADCCVAVSKFHP